MGNLSQAVIVIAFLSLLRCSQQHFLAPVSNLSYSGRKVTSVNCILSTFGAQRWDRVFHHSASAMPESAHLSWKWHFVRPPNFWRQNQRHLLVSEQMLHLYLHCNTYKMIWLFLVRIKCLRANLSVAKSVSAPMTQVQI